jgi:hypothetical protein
MKSLLVSLILLFALSTPLFAQNKPAPLPNIAIMRSTFEPNDDIAVQVANGLEASLKKSFTVTPVDVSNEPSGFAISILPIRVGKDADVIFIEVLYAVDDIFFPVHIASVGGIITPDVMDESLNAMVTYINAAYVAALETGLGHPTKHPTPPVKLPVNFFPM